ncbi:hypothetical protein [Brevundimonas sp. PAMC22021]|jgi:hypothetical protein|uniref:hypothetical protein n=1 Tax=Brevundimonas sp. PAMC22021 TaxID=2861285 RepID=UPI001C63AE12|nr:hypothetical protein [Brevundimonas sp. PAMC22021]QYF87146.1 hypothetical protein KY493_01080 [Brevundimonas sp. PAMC22021]
MDREIPVNVVEDYEDDAYDDADIVEWYEARPVTVPTAVAAGSVIAAFALGALTAAGVLLLLQRLDD